MVKLVAICKLRAFIVAAEAVSMVAAEEEEELCESG